MTFKKVGQENGMKFKCKKCGTIRCGSDPKECEHAYADYGKYENEEPTQK